MVIIIFKKRGCMWFEHAIGKEKINFLFNNELSLVDVGLESFYFHSYSTLRFHFICKKIPSSYPEKWNKEGFNSLSLVFNLGEILSFESKGNKVGFICTPDLVTQKDKSSISIFNDDLIINCEAKFLTIEGITPYIDERWD